MQIDSNTKQCVWCQSGHFKSNAIDLAQTMFLHFSLVVTALRLINLILLSFKVTINNDITVSIIIKSQVKSWYDI